jgi:hypothetical protein
VLVLAACGGKTDSASMPAPDSTAAPMAAPVVDSVTPPDSVRPDTAKAAAPAAAPATKPAAKAETGDHDIAIKPKFKIDEKSGKIDTIKRP